MNLTTTPQSNRVHITILGRRNVGKSSLINALANQQVAVVSNIAGTTTDLVNKSMEIQPIGAVLFTDTPGFDDIGDLGAKRVERTIKALERTDLAIMLFDTLDEIEQKWYKTVVDRRIPIITVINKIDIRTNTAELFNDIKELTAGDAIAISTYTSEGIDMLLKAITSTLESSEDSPSITGNLVGSGDTVLLVMPQDSQAPKGRLILPQVQTIRELLDKRAIIISCTPDMMERTLHSLVAPPKVVITDSQVFDIVHRMTPKESLLTSFSILMAAHKGDINSFINGARQIDALTPNSRVLIAEACTHAPLSEDIGREKIPMMLRKRIGEDLRIDIVSGADFPADLSQYDLIIHCGGCMFNRKHVLHRITMANNASVPITNYGVAIAHITGILSKIAISTE